MKRNPPINELLEDEVLIIKDGGEIPEVTYHSSLFYLTRDPDGPGISLSEDDLRPLKKAVVEGYRKIIIRDLMIENRDKGLYRGLERCAANWDRVVGFCERENLDMGELAEEVCKALKLFFYAEVNDVITLGKSTCVNCTVETLIDFFSKVGVDPASLPKEFFHVSSIDTIAIIEKVNTDSNNVWLKPASCFVYHEFQSLI